MPIIKEETVTPQKEENPPKIEQSSNIKAEDVKEEDVKQEIIEFVEVEEELKKKIQKQIEFYFSDSNFPGDNFLKSQADKNTEGYVSLYVLATFNRLRLLTTDIAILASSVKDSTEVELNEDHSMIKRQKPVPEELLVSDRSIFVKGIDLDWKLDQLEEFFNKESPGLKSIRIRRDKEKKFNGKCYVELESSEEVARMVKNEKLLKINDVVLEIQSKNDYLAKKKEKKREEVAQRLKKKRKLDEEAKEQKEQKRQKIQLPPYEKGCILKFEGPGVSQTSREELKTLVEPYGPIAYVDYAREQPKGYVRFGPRDLDKGDTTNWLKPDTAKRAAEALTEKKVQLGEKDVVWSSLAGEEEEDYYMSVQENKSKKGKGGRGRGRGARGRGARGRGARGRGAKGRT